jgi:hypothetical protein
MLLSSSFIPFSTIVDNTPQNIRQQLINELIIVKDSFDGFRPCQINTSLVKSYGVLSTPPSSAMIVADAQINVIKTEACCSSGTDTDTDSATGSDASIDKFVQDNSINGNQDNVLTHMDINAAAAINTSDISNDTSDFSSGGENMSVLPEINFQELSKLLSVNLETFVSIKRFLNHASFLSNSACISSE